MGGGFALLLVSGHGFSAASINYGGKLPPDVDDFLKTACPVVGSYGALAKWEQGDADALQRALQRALVPHDVKEYPEAGHSFMNNHKHFFLKLLRWTGVGYNEAANQDARRRITAFFHTHLQGQAPDTSA
jgi:carboxymethylenebutenolidase